MNTTLRKTPSRSRLKQTGVTLLQVVLGLSVTGLITVMTINLFTGTTDDATNFGAVQELAAGPTKLDSYSATFGRACRPAGGTNPNVPGVTAIFTTTINVHGDTIQIGCDGDDFQVIYPVTMSSNHANGSKEKSILHLHTGKNQHNNIPLTAGNFPTVEVLALNRDH